MLTKGTVGRSAVTYDSHAWWLTMATEAGSHQCSLRERQHSVGGGWSSAGRPSGGPSLVSRVGRGMPGHALLVGMHRRDAALRLYLLAGLVIERATDTTVADAPRQEILDPLKLDDVVLQPQER